MNATELKELDVQLRDLLKLRTLPVAVKLLESVSDLEKIPKLRRPQAGTHFSSCQLVSQVRYSGITMGITHDNVLPNSNCGGVFGLNKPSKEFLSGEKMVNVWFDNIDAAREHQEQMPRVAPGKYNAVALSPLRSARLDYPNIVLFYGTPGQMILFINGLQWKNYERFEFSVTGESACADSWGHALATGKTSLSIPCFAERRFGGVADDELLMALRPDELERAIEGLHGLYKNGFRYPITPYGAATDPGPGMDVSYGASTNKSSG